MRLVTLFPLPFLGCAKSGTAGCGYFGTPSSVLGVVILIGNVMADAWLRRLVALLMSLVLDEDVLES